MILWPASSLATWKCSRSSLSSSSSSNFFVCITYHAECRRILGVTRREREEQAERQWEAEQSERERREFEEEKARLSME